MSTSLRSIPKRARVQRYAHATSPDGARSATLTVYADDASRGYQTDYQPVPTAWYAIDAPGTVRRAWRYSGARLARALADYNRAIADLRDGGWTVTE